MVLTVLGEEWHMMRCPDEGTLRSYLDGELGAENLDEVEGHLGQCASCQQAVNRLREQGLTVRTALDALPVRTPSARDAWQRFEARRSMTSAGRSLLWRFDDMTQMFRYRGWRVAVAAALIVALLTGVTAIDPLRTAAARFLGIFRVQKFAVVQVDPLKSADYEGMVKQVFGEPQIDKAPQKPVDSIEAASEEAGFRVLEPGTLPDGLGFRTKLYVEPGGTARTEVNVPAARSLLEAAGLPTDALPEGMERLPVTASISPSVVMRYQAAPGYVEIVQGRSPEVDVPEGVDLARLGEVGLRFMGLPAEEAGRMSRSIDWATTLVVPVPTNMATVREVPVRGTTGYLMQAPQGKSGNQSLLFWEEGGIFYAVGGNVQTSRLAEVAESLK